MKIRRNKGGVSISIVIKDLNYTYMAGSSYEKKALQNINVEVKSGEFVGIIGHTGSGKSTLVQHLNGLLLPQSGQVFINDMELVRKSTNLKTVRQQVGVVFQYPEHQLFEETVYKDIAFGPINQGLDGEELDRRVREALIAVGLDESILEKSPFELSGGQKRRVAIAGVLAMDPKILVLDEPAAGLDPKGRNDFYARIKALHEAKNITVILVSHSMEDIALLVGRIIVMNGGRVEMDGKPADIFKESEKLESIGLSVPQITKLMRKLKEVNPEISDGVFTVRDAKIEILRILNRKKAGE